MSHRDQFSVSLTLKIARANCNLVEDVSRGGSSGLPAADVKGATPNQKRRTSKAICFQYHYLLLQFPPHKGAQLRSLLFTAWKLRPITTSTRRWHNPINLVTICNALVHTSALIKVFNC